MEEKPYLSESFYKVTFTCSCCFNVKTRSRNLLCFYCKEVNDVVNLLRYDKEQLEAENKKLKETLATLNAKLYNRTRELNRNWEESFNEVHFDREDR